MLHINPSEIPVPQLHGYLLGSVSPRPICFASTVDAQGQVNLAPYSFFNVFSANPPVLIFSPARRVQGNTTKHTLENVLETKEVVVNIVSYAMVQQMSLASTEYPKGVNEFVKAGFTEVASEMVKPPRVAEAPVQMECRVREVMSLGEHGGAGNLVIVEVVKLHIDENILDEEGVIDPLKIDTVARMGGNWYSRAKAGLFEVPKPLRTLGIGVDALPEEIRLSNVLTGNDLGQLANVGILPQSGKGFAADAVTHQEAHNYLEAGQLEAAWNVLLLK
ncbi:MAG: flavin reductase family protein [Flavobacteriaceae bacterium]